MFFWMCIWISRAFLFPILLKVAPRGVFSKIFPIRSLRTVKPESVCFLTSLQYQTWAYDLWVSIYILLSTLCTLCLKVSSFPLVLSLVGVSYSHHNWPSVSTVSVCLSICTSLCLCGESSGIRWTRRSSQRDGLFSALNEIWQLEYANHDLIYPPNWKAREELNAREGSAVCFADLGQLSYST